MCVVEVQGGVLGGVTSQYSFLHAVKNHSISNSVRGLVHPFLPLISMDTLYMVIFILYYFSRKRGLLNKSWPFLYLAGVSIYCHGIITKGEAQDAGM